MKKFDPNNFVIDDVFKYLDKKYKKKTKKSKVDKKTEDFPNPVEEISQETIDNECYTITINV